MEASFQRMIPQLKMTNDLQYAAVASRAVPNLPASKRKPQSGARSNIKTYVFELSIDVKESRTEGFQVCETEHKAVVKFAKKIKRSDREGSSVP